MADQYIKVGHATSGSGSITTPGSTTNTAAVRWSGTTGSALLDSGVLIDASNNMSGVAKLSTSGSVGIGVGAATLGMCYLVNTLANANEFGFYSFFAGSSTAVTSIKGFVADISTSATSYTCVKVNAYDGGVTAGALSTITRAVIFDSSRGITATGTITNSAHLADNSTFTGSWFINSTSTNPSRFGGVFGIAGNNDASVLLNLGLSANPLTGTQQYGCRVNHVATSDATGSIAGFVCNFTTANSTFTVPYRAGFWSINTAKGALSTITRDINFYASGSPQGTNNATIADNITFTGSWFINSSSTNPSFVNGSFLIKTTDKLLAGAISRESLSVSQSAVAGEEANGHYGAVFQTTVGSALGAMTGGNQVAAFGQYRRIITTDTTDANAAYVGGIVGNIRCNIAATKTITDATTTWAPLIASTIVNDGAGAFALSNYAGLYVEPNSVNTGSRKYGIYIGNQTGSTTNYALFSLDSKSSFGGAICTRKLDVASTASITALDNSQSFVKLTGSTATTLHGISSATPIDGQRLVVYNATGQVLTIKHQSGSAAAADQITTMTGADVVTVGNGCAEFIYDSSDSKWINTNINP
jgi:hypothetical protein